MPLRCVYTDLDGTLLGPLGSLFRDPDGNFTLKQARALEACHRADVEVVIMSGRREAQVMADARLLGQTSYIYEAGCAMVIDGERTFLTGDWQPDENGNPAQKMLDAGIPELLFERFAPTGSSGTRRGTSGRELSLLMRGKVDVAEANALIAENGHEDLRFLDNGAIGRRMEGIEGRTHAYHLVPGGASKAKGVDAHRRARGYDPDGVHRDRRLDRGPRGVGRRSAGSSSSRTGPSTTRRCATRCPASPTRPSPRARWARGSTRPSSRRSSALSP